MKPFEQPLSTFPGKILFIFMNEYPGLPVHETISTLLPKHCILTGSVSTCHSNV